MKLKFLVFIILISSSIIVINGGLTPDVDLDFQLLKSFIEYDRVQRFEQELMNEESRLLDIIRYFIYRKTLGDVTPAGTPKPTTTTTPNTPAPTFFPPAPVTTSQAPVFTPKPTGPQSVQANGESIINLKAPLHADFEARRNSPNIDEWVLNNIKYRDILEADIANPASVYCHEKGGYETNVKSENGEYGVCHLPSGEAVESWALYRREH